MAERREITGAVQGLAYERVRLRAPTVDDEEYDLDGWTQAGPRVDSGMGCGLSVEGARHSRVSREEAVCGIGSHGMAQLKV